MVRKIFINTIAMPYVKRYSGVQNFSMDGLIKPSEVRVNQVHANYNEKKNNKILVKHWDFTSGKKGEAQKKVLSCSRMRVVR